MKHTNVALALAACLLLVGLMGCGSGVKSVAEIKDTNIKKIHALYSFYMSNNQYTGPASEEVFREYCGTAEGKFAIKRMGMDPEKIDEYFKSERDEEPFVIRYGLKGVADHAIVFEAVGVDGKRMIAFGTPAEFDSAEYDDYLSGELVGDSPDGSTQGFEEEEVEQEEEE